MKICYSFASRSRPKKFFAALNNIREMSASPNYYVIAKLDMDDPAMNNVDIRATLESYPEVVVKWGYSKNKIHAINRDLNLKDTPCCDVDIVCCHSDDMVFIKKGFDNIIRKHMKKGVYLHFPDGFANHLLCTYSIMHIDYYHRDGFIYNPAYMSLFADNEQMEVAKKRKRYLFIEENILLHKHPAWGKAQTDILYKKNESLYYQDQIVYNNRKAINFEL